MRSDLDVPFSQVVQNQYESFGFMWFIDEVLIEMLQHEDVY